MEASGLREDTFELLSELTIANFLPVFGSLGDFILVFFLKSKKNILLAQGVVQSVCVRLVLTLPRQKGRFFKISKH